MTSYIKERLKVLVGISKPKIVKYESCLTLNQKVNNIRKSRFQPATLLKLTLLHGCFSRFLNCTNVTKSRNTSHMVIQCKCNGRNSDSVTATHISEFY